MWVLSQDIRREDVGRWLVESDAVEVPSAESFKPRLLPRKRCTLAVGMKVLLRLLAYTLLLAAWLPSPCPAESATVPDAEAAQHIGEHASVEGVVTAVSTSKRGNTFINFGGVYPNQTFTGWIPAGTPLASDPSIKSLQGKKVKITGLIELYRGKPEIKVLSRDQITEE
jgi:hypothetical protein